LGKGFYNEFGIDTALGFKEAKIGGWFHKIGVGLLKKTDSAYNFSKKYELQPATFNLTSTTNKLLIDCHSKIVNGYGYILTKTIELQENSFSMHYLLKNTGNKTIITDEYVHNFMAINNASIGKSYMLKFPFQLQPTLFEETINPAQKVTIGTNDFTFKDTPKEPFFFSNLSGNEQVDAAWELVHLDHKVGIRETGNFKTDKINLWGWGHVISPELFFKIKVLPNQAIEWTRGFEIFKVM